MDKDQRPPVACRSSNGTPLYIRDCPDCGKQMPPADSRKLNKPCHPCSGLRRRTHGLSKHPIYQVWVLMIARCYQPSVANFKYYGGRGIAVCDEWRNRRESFFDWALTNGWAPGLEIHRVNNDGDYEPANCVFVTHQENSQTRRHIKTTPAQARKARELLRGGLPMKEVATLSGASYMAVWHINHDAHVWGNV